VISAATQQDVASRDVTPDLAETDRALLANTLRDLSDPDDGDVPQPDPAGD